MISEGSLVKVIAAEGEHKASSALAAAADVIQESPHALQVSPAILSHTLLLTTYSILQLRYLQTLNSISAEHNSTIIFPMPINISQHF